MTIASGTLAQWVPAWLAPWLIRFGAYLQAIGRDCYHQCSEAKQVTIKAKLNKVYERKEPA